MDGQYWKGDPTMSTNEWLLTSDFWQFLEPWHGRWYEYEIFIASCTDNIYDLENERWLLGDMIDHVGIYGSRVAEGLSASNVGLVVFGTACQIYCYAQYCVTQSVSPTVPENPSGPIVDYFLVLTCAACGSQLCGARRGLLKQFTSSRSNWILPSQTVGWPLRYADFMWVLGGL